MFGLTIMTVWLFGISIMDMKNQKVPLWMLVIGGGLTLMVLAYEAVNNNVGYIHILQGMLPGGILLLAAAATKKAGYGDGIVLLYLGMVSGKSFLLMGISLFFISVYSIILLVFRKAGRDYTIPYLPFLAVSWMIVVYP